MEIVSTCYISLMENNVVFQIRVPKKLRIAALAGAARRGRSLADFVRELMEKLARDEK